MNPTTAITSDGRVRQTRGTCGGRGRAIGRTLRPLTLVMLVLAWRDGDVHGGSLSNSLGSQPDGSLIASNARRLGALASIRETSQGRAWTHQRT